MRTPPEHLAFDDDHGPVLARMAEQRAAGRGWVNIQPDVDVALPPTNGIFSGRGSPLPLATWTPGGQRRKVPAAATIGLQHGTGAQAARRLEERGVAMPIGWTVTQDHPRRGLVVEVPVGVGDAEVLPWLLAAAGALCPVGFSSWVATIHA